MKPAVPVQEQIAQALWVQEQAEQTSRVSMTFTEKNSGSWPYKKKSERWYLRDVDERAQNLCLQLSKVMAQIVRHNHKGQIWFRALAKFRRNQRLWPSQTRLKKRSSHWLEWQSKMMAHHETTI